MKAICVGILSLFTQTVVERNLNINRAEWLTTIFQHVTEKTRNSKQLSGGEKPRIKGQPLKISFEKETPHYCHYLWRVEVRLPTWKTECKRKSLIWTFTFTVSCWRSKKQVRQFFFFVHIQLSIHGIKKQKCPRLTEVLGKELWQVSPFSGSINLNLKWENVSCMVCISTKPIKQQAIIFQQPSGLRSSCF